MTTPDQWARLVALRDRGIVKARFERFHPYRFAMTLGRSNRDRRKFETDADGYVRRYLSDGAGTALQLLSRGRLAPDRSAWRQSAATADDLYDDAGRLAASGFGCTAITGIKPSD